MAIDKPTRRQNEKPLSNDRLRAIYLALGTRGKVGKVIGSNPGERKAVQFVEKAFEDLEPDLKEKIKNICQNRQEWVWLFAEVATTKGRNTVRELAEAKDAYTDSEERFRVFAKLAKAHDSGTVDFLAAAKDVYGNDLKKFLVVRDVIVNLAKADGYFVVSAIAAAKDVYGNDLKKFLAVRDEIVNLDKAHGYHAVSILEATRRIYGNSWKKFLVARDMIAKVANAYKKSDRWGREYVLNSLDVSQDVYGNSEVRFRIFTDLAKAKGGDAVRSLARAKDAYTDSKERFRVFADLAKGAESSSAVDALADAKGAYGDSLEMFRVFAEVAKVNWYAVSGLAQIKDAYAGSEERFRIFADVAKVDREAVLALARAKHVYGDNLKMLYAFAEVAKSNHGFSDDYVVKHHHKHSIDALAKAKNAYAGSEERFRVFVDLAKSQDGDVILALAEAKDAYASSQKGFDAFVNLAKDKGKDAVKALSSAKAIYGDNWEKFLTIADLIIEIAKTHGVWAVRALADAKSVYGENDNMFHAFAKVAKTHGEYHISTLVKIKDAYAGSEEMFRTFSEVANAKSEDTVFALAQAKNAYGDNLEMLRAFAEIAKNSEIKVIDELAKVKSIYQSDTARLRICRDCLEFANAESLIILGRMVDVWQASGKEMALEFLGSLKQKSSGLIGSTVPAEIRKDPDYPALVEYAFPKGNYSNHEKNLAMGDRLRHLAGYKYDKKGYPVELSGLKGFRLAEGTEENPALLGEYQKRLGAMRHFIAHRELDGKALKKDFETLLEKEWKDKTHLAFAALWSRPEIGVKDKLALLVMSEAMRLSATKSAQPSEAMADLLVLYKYVYLEDLEGYIRRTADETRTQKDPISQNRNLWNELSNVYGENAKHVLRNEVMAHLLEKSTLKDEVMETMEGLMGQEKAEGEAGFSEKQWERIKSSFQNERIPEDQRKGVVLKQLIGMVGSNTTWEVDEEKQQFEAELAAHLDEVFEMKSTAERTQALRNKEKALMGMRKMARTKLGSLIQKIVQRDIGRITEEVTKYEEILEIENKETRMGGEKEKEVKKSAKKRSFRGFFTKTAETANARMGAYLCIAGDVSMWKSSNYFELVLRDEETGKCAGLVMLLKIKARDGKSYLWYGPNPFESLVSAVSSSQCHDYLYNTITDFAEKNGFDGVVVPPKREAILGACTNRGGDFPDLVWGKHLKDARGNPRIVDFGKEVMLGESYSYEGGALIWKRPVK